MPAWEPDEPPAFVQALGDRNEAFGDSLATLFREARGDGALSAKTKALLVLALDAAGGYDEGVEILADQARDLGASEDEIRETVEVVALICGLQGLDTAVAALDD